MNLIISKDIIIPENEILLSAIRSSGPGGQHTNKVSTAIQLKFDIEASSLPDEIKARLLKIDDQRLTKEGVIIIKSQKSRSQLRNREEAKIRLIKMIQKAIKPKKKRKNTKPTKLSIQKRLISKKHKSEIKISRKKIDL